MWSALAYAECECGVHGVRTPHEDVRSSTYAACAPCVSHRRCCCEAAIENALQGRRQLKGGSGAGDGEQDVRTWEPPVFLEKVRERTAGMAQWRGEGVAQITSVKVPSTCSVRVRGTSRSMTMDPPDGCGIGNTDELRCA